MIVNGRYEYKCEDCNKKAVVRESKFFYCATCWFKNFTDRRETNAKR